VEDVMNLFALNTPETAFRDFGAFAVLMRRGDLFEVDNSALTMMRTLRAAPATDTALASVIAREYGVPDDEALRDVRSFLVSAVDTGIVLRDGAVTAAQPVGRRACCSTHGDLRCWSYARETTIPLKCKFNVTYRCNIACKFCYNGDRPGTPGPYTRSTELDLSEVERLFGELWTEGTFILTLTGGEPFVRKDLDSILTAADKIGFAIEILTNGSLITTTNDPDRANVRRPSASAITLRSRSPQWSQPIR